MNYKKKQSKENGRFDKRNVSVCVYNNVNEYECVVWTGVAGVVSRKRMIWIYGSSLKISSNNNNNGFFILAGSNSASQTERKTIKY